jgi:hypothetical protein
MELIGININYLLFINSKNYLLTSFINTLNYSSLFINYVPNDLSLKIHNDCER